MAMVTCPECGKSISDQAEVCPNCGKRMMASSLTKDMAEVYARRNKNEKSQEKLTGCLIKFFLCFLILLIITVVLCIISF